MTTKEAFKHLNSLFNPNVKVNAFPLLTLPLETLTLLDNHLSQFGASQSVYGGGYTKDNESERERTKWREGLLELWSLIEPLPGNELNELVIARLSAFILILEKLSSAVGDDDEAALISRRDIGTVWWGELLRRVALGKPSTTTGEISGVGKIRKPIAAGSRKGKEVLAAGRPLVISREAMTGARNMIVWGMALSIDGVVDNNSGRVSGFCSTVITEYESRAVALLQGSDEGFGVRTLEECLIKWGEVSTKAFFLQISSFLTLTHSSLLPYLSLLVSFLTKNSAKAYHALQTPLLSNLNSVGFLSQSPSAVTLTIKCLTILLVTLPVIIGDALIGAMAVYGRVISWERFEEEENVTEKEQEEFTDSISSALPDPTVLFTVLYGIYPCNFTAFLKDAVSYLREKQWVSPKGDGEIGLDSIIVRERSKQIIRLHALHPSLIISDLSTELTDTSRWRGYESADVMADCDRNVVQIFDVPDLRRAPVPFGYESIISTRRARSPTQKVIGSELQDEEDDNESSDAPTPNAGDRNRSRSSTPHLPATTHYANFQALQQLSVNTKVPAPAEETQSGGGLSPYSLSASALSFSKPDRSRDSSAFPSLASSRRNSITTSRSNLTSSIVQLASPDNTGTTSPNRSSSIRTTTTLGASSQHARSPNSISTTTTPTPAYILKLQSDLVLLKGEVDFQTYLKGLHLAHMGTLHREKVLESGAEAERQSLYRTIRTLRAQLKLTQSSLEQLRSESIVTKGNWIAHIDDLKEKLKGLRETRVRLEAEATVLKAEIVGLKELGKKSMQEVEGLGAELFDLQNQATLDAIKLSQVAAYESRILALSKTLAICDEDLCLFREQKRDMDKLVGEWKKSELITEATDAELARLKRTLLEKENEVVSLRETTKISSSRVLKEIILKPKDDVEKMREELERLRNRNFDLEEAVRESKGEE